MLIPVIRVKDKMTGTTRIVGTNSHDCLLVYPSRLEYYNLQNGCGSADAYDFICEEHDPKDGVTPEKAVQIFTDVQTIALRVIDEISGAVERAFEQVTETRGSGDDKAD